MKGSDNHTAGLGVEGLRKGDSFEFSKVAHLEERGNNLLFERKGGVDCSRAFLNRLSTKGGGGALLSKQPSSAWGEDKGHSPGPSHNDQRFMI